MANTNPWWRSRRLGTILAFVLAVSMLILVIIGRTPTQNTNLGISPISQASIPSTARSASSHPTTVAAVKTSIRLTSRDAIDPEMSSVSEEPEQGNRAPESANGQEQSSRMDHGSEVHTGEMMQDSTDNESEADTEIAPLEPACLVNGDCSSGYKCVEGFCEPGCDKHQDCPAGYRCRYGRWGYRCFAMKGRHRECLEHLRFCMQDFQCCSGYCGQRAKGKDWLCWPKGGRGM